MTNKLKKLIEKYYELIVLDREYENKYELLNNKNYSKIEMTMIKSVFDNLEWRKFTKGKEKQEIENILNNENNDEIGNLLGIEDYYYDEVYELKCNNQKNTERYKLANKIKFKSSKICRKIYDLKFSQKKHENSIFYLTNFLKNKIPTFPTKK